MPKFQLYYKNMKIELPWSVSHSRKTGSPIVNKKCLLNQVYTFWPDGTPCTLVNIWLQTITFKSTGESAETFASHISHYVRDCYNLQVQLFDVDDNYLCEFAERLTEEKKLKYNAIQSARNGNHIAYTIRRVLEFLIWYQTNYRLISQPKLIGELGTGARVTIEWRTDSRGRPTIYHPAIPTRRPLVGDKKPMPDDFIGKLIDMANLLRAKPRIPFGSTNGPKYEQLVAKNEYLHSRRMISLKLTMLTGLRPDELNKLPIHLNSNPIATRKLFLPTLKTRQKSPPIREFPLTLEDALEISIYLNDRIKFLNLISAKPESVTAFLLSQDGTPVMTRSLARDFKRLCDLSGLKDTQVCLSMFRHRFITTQIAYEIKKELRRDIAQKDLWQEAVQRKILSRVAKLTGHTDPMSLKHYFNEAFAIVLTNTHEITISETEALIIRLEHQIDELSKSSAIHHNTFLAEKIAVLETTVKQLKLSHKSQYDNSNTKLNR
ncbi:tyrosine-type recombinase/integrase [Pseudomonas sp. B5(2017)]|uniref:tyrosine-type recombinase/integrase n=1 Tax=Pseudomonas sp. B5(2017) TaxID=1981714 RepID=UPI00111C3CF2|nr:tyrosine-type recombinase/integrase [Pseudomonas sp. B5(2017)]